MLWVYEGLPYTHTSEQQIDTTIILYVKSSTISSFSIIMEFLKFKISHINYFKKCWEQHFVCSVKRGLKPLNHEFYIIFVIADWMFKENVLQRLFRLKILHSLRTYLHIFVRIIAFVKLLWFLTHSHLIFIVNTCYVTNSWFRGEGGHRKR